VQYTQGAAANTNIQNNPKSLLVIMKKEANWPADPQTIVNTTRVATVSDPSAWPLANTPHLTRA